MKNVSVAVSALGCAVTIAMSTACLEDRGSSPGVVSSSGDETMGSETGVPGSRCESEVAEPGETCDAPDLGDGSAGTQSSGQETRPGGQGAAGDDTEGPVVVGGIDGAEVPDGTVGDGAGGADEPEAPVVVCDEASISSDSPNSLVVAVDAATQLVHNEIFGVLMETLGRDVNGGLYVGRDSNIPNTDGLRDDVIQGFIEAGVGVVQWPGGCAANNYNWQPNVNPLNTMGTDLFMEFCEMIDAEPYITGRPNAANAQSNRDWVEYINDNPAHPEWSVKYFKVGNEVWGCGGNQNYAQYEPNYRANYDALSSPVNGKELFIVAGTDLIGRNAWLDTMLGNLATTIDGVEVHDYLYFPDSIPNVGFSDDQYYNVVNRANRGQIAPRIEEIRSILDERDPSGRVKIIEDEWGDWLIGFNEQQDTWLQQGTLMDAISAGEQLHVFMANADRIQAAALAQPINVIHSLFLTRPGDGVLVKTPTFHVFNMFLPHHTANARFAPNALESENIQANNASFPVLSSAATVDETGAVNVSLVNVDLVNTRSIDVSVDSSTAAYTLTSARVLTGPAKDSYNPFAQPETVTTRTLDASSYEFCGRSLSVALPAKSVVMFRLEPR